MTTTATLLNSLNNGLVEIEFTKVTTGEKRLMRATLNASVLKESMRDKFTTSNVPQSDTADRINVWDVDANDWRSVYTKNVTSVKAA